MTDAGPGVRREAAARPAGVSGLRYLPAVQSPLPLVRTMADSLDSASPRGPAAPYWLDLEREAYAARLAELKQWADTVLRPNYGGYELRDCWPSRIHVIWELSTLAAEWHQTYSGKRPDLPRALEFYDRWLPRTMRLVSEYSRACIGLCSVSRRLPYDWTGR
jgi:hypothetical protein